MHAYHNVPIREWAVEDRPREKLLKRGLAALTDAELLAILLSTGTRELSALDLARQILSELGSIDGLARSDVARLTRIKGIGKAKAIAIISAFELSRRKGDSSDFRLKVRSIDDAAQYLSRKLSDQNQEIFYVLYLSRSHEVIAENPIFRGGVASTIIDPRIVLREAINHLASSIIISHNHPSGNLDPSRADRDITKQLFDGCKLFNIQLLDHIIVSSRGYFSFNEQGLLKSS